MVLYFIFCNFAICCAFYEALTCCENSVCSSNKFLKNRFSSEEILWDKILDGPILKSLKTDRVDLKYKRKKKKEWAGLDTRLDFYFIPGGFQSWLSVFTQGYTGLRMLPSWTNLTQTWDFPPMQIPILKHTKCILLKKRKLFYYSIC